MDSADLKVQRAGKHYAELSALIRKHKPFRYFVETNFKTGEKATFAKKDEEVANHGAIIIGDIIHNLRSALDHTYWNCTEQFAKSDGEIEKHPISRNLNRESAQRIRVAGSSFEGI